MKTTYRKFRCPDCGEIFLHNTTESPEPEICPVCENTGEPIERDPILLPPGFKGPRISSEKARSADGYLKAMEEGVKFREDLAVEQGMTREEARTLDMGNAGGPLAMGEIAVKTVDNSVSQTMAAAPGGGMAYQSLAHDPNIRSGAARGPVPFAGAKAMNVLRQNHSRSGGVVTESPALETGRVNYRNAR